MGRGGDPSGWYTSCLQRIEEEDTHTSSLCSTRSSETGALPTIKENTCEDQNYAKSIRTYAVQLVRSGAHLMVEGCGVLMAATMYTENVFRMHYPSILLVTALIHALLLPSDARAVQYTHANIVAGDRATRAQSLSFTRGWMVDEQPISCAPCCPVGSATLARDVGPSAQSLSGDGTVWGASTPLPVEGKGAQSRDQPWVTSTAFSTHAVVKDVITAALIDDQVQSLTDLSGRHTAVSSWLNSTPFRSVGNKVVQRWIGSTPVHKSCSRIWNVSTPFRSALIRPTVQDISLGGVTLTVDVGESSTLARCNMRSLSSSTPWTSYSRAIGSTPEQSH
jgi:hypothetical protein